MPRDSRVYLEDILEASRKITANTAGLSKAAFLGDEKTFQKFTAYGRAAELALKFLRVAPFLPIALTQRPR